MLVRIAALAAVDAPPVSYLMNLEAAADAGVDAEQVRGVLPAIAPIVGTARVASATGSIASALEVEIEVAELDEAEPENPIGATGWQPSGHRWRLFPLVVSWLATGVALMVAAGLLPGVNIDSFWGALLVAAVVAVLNAVIPPVLAALRLPLTLVLGFLLVLLADAGILLARRRPDRRRAHGRQLRLGAAGGARGRRGERRARRSCSARRRRRTRSASRSGSRAGRAIIARTDVPGIVFLEIDGLALPVLRRAMRDGNAPTMARWLAEARTA